MDELLVSGRDRESENEIERVDELLVSGRDRESENQIE